MGRITRRSFLRGSTLASLGAFLSARRVSALVIVPGSEPDDHLAELPKVWIETTPLGHPFMVSDCPRLTSPYYEWDENTRIQYYEWDENTKMQFIGERSFLWVLMKLAVQKGKAIHNER